MNAQSRVVVLGDQAVCEKIKAALAEHGITPLDPGNLEIRDEFQVRRWFLENNPTHVFVCPGIRGQNSVAEFTFTVSGSINAIMASLGIAERTRLIVTWPTPEHFLLRRLCELLYFQSQMDCCDIIARGRETVTDFAKRAVLEMRDVSAKEAHTRRAQGQVKGREVRDSILPQPAGDQQHRSPVAPLLEVPFKEAQGASPGDLHSQCAAPTCQEAQNPVQHHAGGV